MKKLLVAALMVLVAMSSVARTGTWVDEVVFSREPSSAVAIEKLNNNELDVFAFSVADPALLARVRGLPQVDYVLSLGSYNEFTFNASGPVFTDGKLNPFSVARIREAMHWLIDRDYLANEILGGLGAPRFTPISGNFADGTGPLKGVLADIAAYYAHDPAKAEAIVTEEMEKLGAVKVGGVWNYGGAPVEIILLIRVEDERRVMGEYFAGLLDNLGFKTVRLIRTNAECAKLWAQSDPANGGWHIYTGGWVTTVIPREETDSIPFFLTNLGSARPLEQSWVNTPEAYALFQRLWDYDFKTQAERVELLERALWLAMEDAHRIFLVDRGGFSPFRSNIQLAADTAGGIYGSQMWALTVNFNKDGVPQEGGSLRVAMIDMLTEPWNPIAGSNFIYDMMAVRATGDYGYGRDTRNGLIYPNRFLKAEVTVVEGLPVGVTETSDWVTLTFADKIEVPADAWIDWDPVKQVFITVGEKYPEGLTALRKSVTYYPPDLWDVPLHDGSKLSIADFVLGMILNFDRGMPESAIYDEAAVPGLKSLRNTHRGYRITSQNPLVIEVYSQAWVFDAELNVSSMFPYYAQGPGMWHTLALGIKAEIDKQLAFSRSKAVTLNADWTSYISGPSLPILKEKLDFALETKWIPYAPTLGKYLTAEEIEARYTALKAWYEAKGHFWVASGEMYLEKAFPLEKAIVLKRHTGYPDSSEKWMFLTKPLEG